jgi:hypothetical protein
MGAYFNTTILSAGKMFAILAGGAGLLKQR